MVRYLLDTDVVSEVLRSRPDPQVASRLRSCRGDAALPSVVWHELVEAADRLRGRPERDILVAFLREVVAASFPVVPYDREAATWHARMRTDRGAIESGPSESAVQSGFTPGMADGIVAAVAAVHGLVLVTGSPFRYLPFPGLTIERWHSGPLRRPN